MSIEWTNLVWKHSPYKGVQKLIHLNLADRADKDGLCFPKQSTIAQDTGATERYVRQTIKRMVADGVLIIIQKGRQYAYRLLRRPEHSSGPDRNSVPVDTGTQFRPYIEPSGEPSEEPKNTAALRATAEEEQMPTAGAFPDDPSTRTETSSDTDWKSQRKPRNWKKKETRPNLPNRGTHAFIVRKIENESVKVGQRTSDKLVFALVKQMREKYGWSYREMEFVIDRFFVRYAHEARAEGDVVKRLIYWLPRLEKETQRSIDNFRKGIDAEEERKKQDEIKAASMAKAMAMIAEEKKKRAQAV